MGIFPNRCKIQLLRCKFQLPKSKVRSLRYKIQSEGINDLLVASLLVNDPVQITKPSLGKFLGK